MKEPKGQNFNLLGLSLVIDYDYDDYEKGDLETPPVEAGITAINCVTCEGVDITELFYNLPRFEMDDLMEMMEEEINDRCPDYD